MKRLIYGNLDAEADWAALAGRRPRQALARRVLETISGFSTLLRVFARDGDVLRTLVPVDPERVLDVPGLPRPEMTSGRLDGERPDAILAWGETPEVAKARPSPPEEGDPEAPLADAVWHLPPPAPEAAARVNHRAFVLELAPLLEDCKLANRAFTRASQVDDVKALEDALGAFNGRPWVVKAPLSAAGRDRYVFSHEDGGTTFEDARSAVERLFQRHGPLVLEPWVSRTDDFGSLGLMGSGRFHWLGLHRQEIDALGGFAGVAVGAERHQPPGMELPDARDAAIVTSRVVNALKEAGYTGAFSIDAFAYEDDGEEGFQPLGEVNARLSFGVVARALLERLGWKAGSLHLGRPDGEAAWQALLDDENVVPLLAPGRDGTGHAAWLRRPAPIP